MIGFLRGRLHEVLPTHVLLDVAGVGYAVGVSPALASGLHVGKDAFFYVYEHIREDAHDLYGFLAASDLALFRQLIGEVVEDLREFFAGSRDIFRSIVFKTVREDTRAKLKGPQLREVKRGETLKPTVRKEEAAAPVSEADLDKALETITE
jgi:hypothetical protein